MSNSQDICTSCGRSKQSDSTGSLTQWVLLCKCDSQAPQKSQVNTINICINCGKRIGGGRSGSFTQWIFRTEVCECTNPQAVERTIRDLTDEEYAGSIVDLSDIKQVEVDKNKFPVDRFAPIEILGSTYDSTVYLSIDKMLGTRVAVKSVDLRSDDNLVRFQKEVRALARLSYPGIVKVLDFAENEGAPYMVMEYIDGVTMREYLKANTILSVYDTVTVVKQLSQTLSYCHSKNILHRDIKPENLLVCAGSEPVEVKLVDFGLACTYDTIANRGDAIAGTPAYMAPDSSKGKTYDIRSEVYSLGCVMFELLTGEPPYKSDNALQLLKMHADAEIPRLSSKLMEDSLDETLEKIVHKCLAKEPDDRFQSMDDLHKAIEQYDSGIEDEAIPESSPEPLELEKAEVKEQKLAEETSKIPSTLFIVFPFILLVAIIGYRMLNSNTETEDILKEVSKTENPFKPDYSTHEKFEHHTFQKGELVNLNSTGAEVNDAYLKRLLVSHSPDLTKIVLDSNEDVNVHNLARVFKSIKLTDATFANKLCNPKYIQTVSNDQSLKLLRLHKPGPADIKAIPRKMKNLTIIAFNNTKITADHIRNLKGILKLDQLRFNYCSIEDGAISEISKLPIKGLAMASCSIGLEDFASLQTKEIMNFLRIKACVVREGVQAKSINNSRTNLGPGIKELLKTGYEDIINAPDSLLKVISNIKVKRINFENYIFTRSSILRLAKIQALERIDFGSCVLELNTQTMLLRVRPKLKLFETLCLSVEMEEYRKK